MGRELYALRLFTAKVEVFSEEMPAFRGEARPISSYFGLFIKGLCGIYRALILRKILVFLLIKVTLNPRKSDSDPTGR